MTPSEFYNLYGPCVTRVVRVTSAAPFKVSADPRRYLFSIWFCSVDLALQPDGGASLPGGGTTIGAGQPPVIFTHAEHGSLPSMGWLISASGWIGTNDALLLMGYAQSAPTPAEVKRAKRG